MQPGRFLVSAFILFIAVANNYLKYVYAYVILGRARYSALDPHIRNILIQLTALALCFGATYILSAFSAKETVRLLGLNRNFLKALIVAAVCALPMFIGGYITGTPQQAASPAKDIFKFALVPGFTEELVYRAFVVGLLVRVAGWHFFPAAFLSGLIFAYGHLYQATDFRSAITIFSFTIAVGIGFAALVRLWEWNVWFTVFLHTFMNAAFVLFDMGDTVLLTPMANIYRGLTILLAAAASIMFYLRRRKQRRAEEKPLPMIIGNR